MASKYISLDQKRYNYVLTFSLRALAALVKQRIVVVTLLILVNLMSTFL